jgi:hypothetical protein
MPSFRWDNIVWPRWLPETARMPLVAQITGAVALTALIMGPWWSRVPSALPPKTPSAIQASFVNQPSAAQATPTRPAHLNLDVRHSLGDVDLAVTVDGKRALASKLEGSGKRFKFVGKRAERGYTRSLELEPGVRIVQVRMHSASDKFDQTRTERFELGPSAVASMRITADRSGLVVVAQQPSTATAVDAAPASASRSLTAVPAKAAPVAAAALQVTQQADALANLVKSIRSMLIAIAGFVASAATGFIVQEFLRSKKNLVFANERRRRGDTPEVSAN